MGGTSDLVVIRKHCMLPRMWIAYTVMAALFFAGSNVLDSVLVRSYEKRPWVLQWSQGIFSLLTLGTVALFVDVRSSWALLLAVAGLSGYLADAVFFYALDRIDVSVSNAGWAILAMLLSVVGFLFFGERWTVLQTVGAGCIIAGVFLLSYWHAHVSVARTILLLTVLAVTAMPINIIQKVTLLRGESFVAVFFWSMLARESVAVIGPLLLPSTRRALRVTLPTLPRIYFLLCALIIAFFLTAAYLIIRAYETGFLSLVAVVNNVQPFFVITFAWVVSRISPGKAARELLTARSVSIKIVSFCIVFFGLALLILSQ